MTPLLCYLVGVFSDSLLLLGALWLLGGNDEPEPPPSNRHVFRPDDNDVLPKPSNPTK